LLLNRPRIIRAADDQRPVVELDQPLRFRPIQNFDVNKLSELNVRLEGLYLTRSATFPPNVPGGHDDPLIAPEGVLPFRVPTNQASANFNQWLSALWFAPSALKTMATADKLSSIYIPYWTYDAFATSRYRGERGEYRLFSKRFQVQRGSAVFIGSPELNPTLQLTAEYEVRPPGREAVNIRIIVGGTLQRPRLSLESDAQPPMSQRDILSYLAFSKETASLLDFEGSPLSSKSGNPNLAGVTKTAGRRLASVALGLAVDEMEGEAGRDLGVIDMRQIAPTLAGILGVRLPHKTEPALQLSRLPSRPASSAGR
jgi:hypothetical protein